MLIGGDDIRNGAITLGTCFYMFFNVCLHLPLSPLVSPRFLFLREFFSRALLSELLEQATSRRRKK